MILNMLLSNNKSKPEIAQLLESNANKQRKYQKISSRMPTTLKKCYKKKGNAQIKIF